MGIATVVALLAPSAPVHAIKREQSFEPWVVQVVGVIAGLKMESCTGVLVATGWVLTARHCKSDRTYFDIGGETTPVPVLEEHSLAPSDLKLLRVDPVYAWQPSYPRLARSFSYRAGTIARSYGVGTGRFFRGSRQEFVTVKVDHRRLKSNWDETSAGVVVRTTNAKDGVQHGDSGGPLVIGNQIVGIASRLLEMKDGSYYAEYADLASINSRIQKVISPRELRETTDGDDAGPGVVSISLQNKKRLVVRMGTKLIRSSKRVIFWRNGVRIGQTDKSGDGAKPVSPRDISTVAFDFDSPLLTTDLLQVGLADRLVDKPDQAQLIYESVIEDAISVNPKASATPIVVSTRLIDGKLAVALDSEYVHLGRRIVFWLNKKYIGEVHGENSAYVGVLPEAGGLSTYRFAQATTGADFLEIGVVSGEPGHSPGQPEQSDLLYSGSAPE